MKSLKFIVPSMQSLKAIVRTCESVPIKASTVYPSASFSSIISLHLIASLSLTTTVPAALTHYLNTISQQSSATLIASHATRQPISIRAPISSLWPSRPWNPSGSTTGHTKRHEVKNVAVYAVWRHAPVDTRATRRGWISRKARLSSLWSTWCCTTLRYDHTLLWLW